MHNNLNKEKIEYLKNLQKYTIIEYGDKTHIHVWAVRLLERFVKHIECQPVIKEKNDK
jgi:hypothetical protein